MYDQPLLENANKLDEELIDMRHPNIIVFGERGWVFVGDNKGTVHLWELTVIERVMYRLINIKVY